MLFLAFCAIANGVMAYARSPLRPWHYVLVIIVVGMLTLLEVKIVLLGKEVVGVPFLFVTTITALFGDYIAGILAIILSCASIGFISDFGWRYGAYTIYRIVEFMIASSIIYGLAWRNRGLMWDNMSLEDTINNLELATRQLKNEDKIKKKDLKRIIKLNKELRTVIDAIMEDQQIWFDSVKKDLAAVHNTKV